MNCRHIVRLGLLVSLVLSLSGCWFVFIPGSMVSSMGDALSGNTGQYCVGESAAVGSMVKMPDGRIGAVQKLEGASSRCSNTALPIRAVVTFD